MELFVWQESIESRRRLKVAILLGTYMAAYETSDHDKFSKLARELNPHEWQYAIRFCPFYSVNAAVENLLTIQAGFEESYIQLSTALSELRAAFNLPKSSDERTMSSLSKAHSATFVLVSLYSSYIDTCRRIRQFVELKDVTSYDRAVRRFTIGRQADHAFVKDLRNYMSHYDGIAISCTHHVGNSTKSNLMVAADNLLYSGYVWKSLAREFLQASESFDLVQLMDRIAKDLGRLVGFHQKLVNRRLSFQRACFNRYRYVRVKHNFQSSLLAANAFRIRSDKLERLCGKEVLHSIVESEIDDSQVIELIVTMANRYRSLREEEQIEVRRLALDLVRRKNLHFQRVEAP